MLFKLIRDGEKNAFQPYMERAASELDLTEKNLENWMAGNPELLFGVERVLVISQSVRRSTHGRHIGFGRRRAFGHRRDKAGTGPTERRLASSSNMRLQ